MQRQEQMNVIIKDLYTQCRQLEASQPNIILMLIDKSESFFYFLDESEQFISLPVGYEDISHRFFKHTPPTPDDIEYAINYIEDEIERVVPGIPSNYALYNANDFIRQIASLCGIKTSTAMSLTRDQLEYLFGQYAEISMGRPARSNEADISPLFYAQLLIFREFMHHLKFASVTIIEAGNSLPPY